MWAGAARSDVAMGEIKSKSMNYPFVQCSFRQHSADWGCTGRGGVEQGSEAARPINI